MGVSPERRKICAKCGNMGITRKGTVIYLCSVCHSKLPEVGGIRCVECSQDFPKPHAHKNGRFGGYSQPKHLKHLKGVSDAF